MSSADRILLLLPVFSVDRIPCRSFLWRILAKVEPFTPSGKRSATIQSVPVFKRVPGSHVHVRTPIMIGVILLLVVLLSAFCYYRVRSGSPPAELQLQQWL